MVPETPRQVNELVVLAREIQAFIESRGGTFASLGGLAVQSWSEPRYTRDVDLTLLTGFGSEEPFIDALLARYRPRRPDARSFALTHRVLLLENADGIGIDVAMGALPFEEEAVKRAPLVEASPGVFLRICAPEDLIVMKAFAGREQDWRDVRFTVVRQGVANLDWPYVYRHLAPLADVKDAPEILTQLRELEERYRGQAP